MDDAVLEHLQLEAFNQRSYKRQMNKEDMKLKLPKRM